MSPPRRRRRRRRRSERPATESSQTPQAAQEPDESTPRRARRRRRGRAGRGRDEPASPRSSEDIFRAERPRPGVVGAPPDGRTLEGVIGELQSVWGVPQSPQEYRITLKIAEEREARGERVASVEIVEEDVERKAADGQPRREKAPAAPRIGAVGETPAGETGAPAARKRSRRRRRRGGRSASS